MMMVGTPKHDSLKAVHDVKLTNSTTVAKECANVVRRVL